MDQIESGLAARVGHRYLDIYALAPQGNLPGLSLHLGELVGEYLERDGPVRNGREHLPGEVSIIAHPRLVHERRIRGEPSDVRPAIQRQQIPESGGIAKDLHPQVGDRFHWRSNRRIHRTASGSDETRASGSTWHASSCP